MFVPADIDECASDVGIIFSLMLDKPFFFNASGLLMLRSWL